MGGIMPTPNSLFQYNGQRVLLSNIRIVKKLLEVLLLSFLTLALAGGEWSTPRPSRFTPVYEPMYLMNGRMCGFQNLCGHSGEEKNLLLHVRGLEF